MPKARLSVGTDTPTGKPASGPAGPYITDEHDDELTHALRRGGARPKAGPRVRRKDRGLPEEAGSED